MIFVIGVTNQETWNQSIGLDAAELPSGTVWIDLLNPTAKEEATVGVLTGVDIPSLADMKEIETSSRLYEADHAAFLTITMVLNADSNRPESTVVTFILSNSHLITVRHASPVPFETFYRRAVRRPQLSATASIAFTELLDSVIDRLADILENISADLDPVSAAIFAQDPNPKRRNFNAMLSRIGRNGDLLSRVRESVVTLNRALAFARHLERFRQDETRQTRFATLGEDLTSLSEQTSFLSNKVNFLLDATLGQINTDQNARINTLSVIAALFLPPTLIASIYGMNFRWMPELEWPFGYPLALLLMVLAGIIPYAIFRWRRWL